MKQILINGLPVEEFMEMMREIISQELKDASHGSGKTQEILSIEDAAQLLGLSKQTLYGHVSKKSIPFYKKFGRLYFLHNELIQFIKDESEESALLVAEKDFTKRKGVKVA